MKEKTDKLLTLVLLLIGVVCTVFTCLFAIKAETNPGSGLWDIVFFVLIAMTAVSIIAALVFVFKGMAEKGNLLKFFIGIVAVAAIIFVLYLLSSGNDISAAMLDKYGSTESASKWIGAFCYLVYILVIFAACAIIYTEIAKSFKKK